MIKFFATISFLLNGTVVGGSNLIQTHFLTNYFSKRFRTRVNEAVNIQRRKKLKKQLSQFYDMDA